MSYWTPAAIEGWLARNLHRFDGPAQYLGTEPNVNEYKRWDQPGIHVKVCMVASWPYEHAAGNQSIPAVYKTVNLGGTFLCDRAYLPCTPRDMATLERDQVPIFGIEGKHPLADYDVVGTSISYVVLLMNFVKMLRMSGIPPRWSEREPEQCPMIMVGGQAYCNPEVMAPVVDCVFLGEAEDEAGNGGLRQVLRMIDMFKSTGLWHTDRVECYRRLARSFNFLYFPRFVDVHYDEAMVMSGYGASQSSPPGMRMPFVKRHVVNLDSIPPLDDPPLLYVDPSLGSGDVEASRGCPAWCTFCRLTYAQKPFRQRSTPYMVDFARSFRNHVGGVEISPFGPDFPMQTNKNELLAALLANVTDKVDTVAQRIDDFISDRTYLMLQAQGGATSITLGVEGVDQRMRDLVGKATSDAEIKQAVSRGIAAGFRKFKLFMIVGLPGEDTGDVARVIQLAKDLAAIRDSMNAEHVMIQFSFTPLLYEAKTPFQWFSAWPVPDHDLIDVANEMRELGILFKIGTKAEHNKVHFFQLCQRASRASGEAVIDVLLELDAGCWGGVPRDMAERLERALQARGFAGWGSAFDERGRWDFLGPEFISTGISDDLLWSVFEKMRDFATYTDSATYDEQFDERYHGNEWINRCDEQCLGNSCGVCSRPDLELRRTYLESAGADYGRDISGLRRIDQTSVACRVRAQIYRPEPYRWADNGFRRHLIRRAGYMAREKTHIDPYLSKNSIWLASDAHGYRDWSAGVDYLEFGMTHLLYGVDHGDERAFLGQMMRELSPWVLLGDWEVFPAAASMRARAGASYYELELQDDPDRIVARLAAWDKAEFVKMTLRQDGSYFAVAQEDVNAKDFVDDLWLVHQGSKLLLRMLARRRAGPYQVWQSLTGKASWIEAAARPALCREVFAKTDEQLGVLDACPGCGHAIPVSLLGRPWARGDMCPRCQDNATPGLVLAGLRQEART